MSTFSERIKQKAEEIGFDKVGIVEAKAIFPETERFSTWLASGFHGDMGWLEREPEKRSDPRLIFPETRSMIVTALNYYTPYQHSGDERTGKISRYAWGDDYHEIVKEKLRDLLDWILAERPGTAGKICVDTAPVMDKAWAVRAGLGWLGKHSNVISSDIGSWFFIGEILLDLELEYDTEIIPDRCGTCTACLDACPTGAIVQPYVVDSRRCISYATIELRENSLPPDIAQNLNGWLYGCDICQDVCPWNRFATPTGETRFQPRRAETSMDVSEVLSYTPEQYVARFRHSAVKRAKLGGLKRNAAALANQTVSHSDSSDVEVNDLA